MIRRICLYGAPNTGKTSLARWLSAELSNRGYKIELVREHVKDAAYVGKPTKGFDQVEYFGRQISDEDFYLREAGLDLIITDAPLLQNVMYAELYNAPGKGGLRLLALEFEQHYPSLNILLLPGYLKYNEAGGRYQNEKEARDIHWRLISVLNRDRIVVPIITSATERDYILASIEAYLLQDQLGEQLKDQETVVA